MAKMKMEPQLSKQVVNMLRVSSRLTGKHTPTLAHTLETGSSKMAVAKVSTG